MTEHEQQRRALWVGVATAVAAGVTTLDKPAPAAWADHVLADFDKRFQETAFVVEERPEITRTFSMTPEEIARFSAVNPEVGNQHALSATQQQKVLAMFEARGVTDARMPFMIISNHGRYTVSEASKEPYL